MTGIIISTPPTVELPPGNSGAGPNPLPGINYQYAITSLPQTWTAAQTFNASTIVLAGTGGTSQVLKQSLLNGAVTVGQLSFTDILGAATGAQLPAFTGDVTVPAGTTTTTLAAGNAGNLNSGTLLAARLPALTGDVTTSAGTVATTIAANAVTNAKAAQMAASTIKGNNTGSLANASDLTVAQTIALLGIWGNVRLAKTAAYPVVNADKGSTIALGGTAFYTLTFSAASGYDANFTVFVINEDTGRGKTIALSGGTNFILWPGQSCIVFNQNNVWKVKPPLQPWMPTSQPTFFVDPTNGLNTNDGLAAGAGGAFQTLAFAASNAYANVYTRNVGSVVIDGSSNTFQEFVAVFYPLNGGGTLIFQNLTWKPINSGFCLQFGDGALVGLTNVTMSSAGTTTPAGFISGHQYGVLDVNAGFVVTPTVTVSGSVFDSDGQTRFNINNGLTINAGTISGFLYRGQQGHTNWNINGAHTFVGTPTINRFLWASQATVMQFQGNVTYSGAITISVGLINQNGVVQNLGGALPGGAPTPTTGGQYNTTITA